MNQDINRFQNPSLAPIESVKNDNLDTKIDKLITTQDEIKEMAGELLKKVNTLLSETKNKELPKIEEDVSIIPEDDPEKEAVIDIPLKENDTNDIVLPKVENSNNGITSIDELLKSVSPDPVNNVVEFPKVNQNTMPEQTQVTVQPEPVNNVVEFPKANQNTMPEQTPVTVQSGPVNNVVEFQKVDQNTMPEQTPVTVQPGPVNNVAEFSKVNQNTMPEQTQVTVQPGPVNNVAEFPKVDQNTMSEQTPVTVQPEPVNNVVEFPKVEELDVSPSTASAGPRHRSLSVTEIQQQNLLKKINTKSMTKDKSLDLSA